MKRKLIFRYLLCHSFEVLSVLFGLLRPGLELEAAHHVEDGVLGEHHLEQRVLQDSKQLTR